MVFCYVIIAEGAAVPFKSASVYWEGLVTHVAPSKMDNSTSQGSGFILRADSVQQYPL